jgi:hypothetical protein
VYYRFSNRWFYEPEAVLQIDGPTNLARLIEDGPRAFSAEDPVGSLYRATPPGDLYDTALDDLEIGAALDVTASVEGLDGIEIGGDDVRHAYVGGGLTGGDVDDDAWVVAVADGVVSGMSPLFEEERHERGFAVLLDADRVPVDGVDLQLLLWEDGALRRLVVQGAG